MVKQQRGGTLLGLIIGLIVGLGIAMGVAVYVTKVPVPFITKGDQRDSGPSEAERNRNWDPNAPLYGNSPAPAPAAQDAGVSTPVPVNPVAQPPAVSADPLGDLMNAQSAKTVGTNTAPVVSADGAQYFVQAGAFRTKVDADAQRARLGMQGLEGRITEREQNGRPVFRVRLGPFITRTDAEQMKQKLDSVGIDSVLIRAQQ